MSERIAGFDGFPRETLRFLAELGKNNKKEWMDEHEEEYRTLVVEPSKRFIAALGPRLRRIAKGIHAEPKVGGSILKTTNKPGEKTPYKTHVDLLFWEGDEHGRNASGFFFRLRPKTLHLGAGNHAIPAESLTRFRKAIADPKTGKELTDAIAKVRGSGAYEIGGANLKKVPKGFPASHERADLLRHDALFAAIDLAVPATLHESAFLDLCERHFKSVAPIHTWLVKSL